MFLSHWHDDVTQWLHIHDVNHSTTSEVLYWIEIRGLWRPFECSELIFEF